MLVKIKYTRDTYEIINDGDFNSNIHINRDSIHYWSNFGVELSDYIKARTKVKSIVDSIGFNNLRAENKEIAAPFCPTDSTTMITYFMGLGYSQADATEKYLDYRSNDIYLAAQACDNRMNNNYIKVIIKYLPITEAERYLTQTSVLSANYRNAALFGTQYGDYSDGIMDFIEDTGGLIGSGLSTYTLNDGMLLADLIQELKDILIN